MYMDVWRDRLGLSDVDHLTMLYKHVASRVPIPCRELEENQTEEERVKRVYHHFVTVHQADGYDDVKWPVVRVCCAMCEEDADAFWCFSMITGLQRPYTSMHGESAFEELVQDVFYKVKLELLLLDHELVKCLESTLCVTLTTVVARWFYTWFACIGASTKIFTALIECPARLRRKCMCLMTAHLLYAAAQDVPRMFRNRNRIYQRLFALCIDDEDALLQASLVRL